MTLEASGKLVARVNIKYLRTLACGEAVHQFDRLSSVVGIITSENWKSIILGLSG